MPFNPVIVPVRNNLTLTKKAVETFRKQDIEGGVEIFIINNASTDGTSEWINTQRDLAQMYFNPPLSVAQSWNRALEHVFRIGATYALVVNNDVELRPDTYRLLVEEGSNFVTAVGRRETDLGPDWKTAPVTLGTRPHPDFSCYVIDRGAYEHVGPFDENFLIAFGEDWDYHVRMHKAGITAYCIDLPFLHHGSMTIKNAEPSEVRKIQMQAERNREYFRRKWGMVGASKEYYDFFGNVAPGAGTEGTLGPGFPPDVQRRSSDGEA